MIQMNLLTKQKETHRLRQQTYGSWVAKRMRGRAVREFGMDMYTLPYLKWVSNNGLLYTAHGTLPSVTWQPGWEGSLEENGYMCIYISL